MLLGSRQSSNENFITDQPINSTVRRLFDNDRQGRDKNSPFFTNYLDTESGIHWLRLRPDCPAKFTNELVSDLCDFHFQFSRHFTEDVNSVGQNSTPGYYVMTSDIEGVFNLGGDLSYFLELIRSQNRDELTLYARKCVRLVHQISNSFNLPLTTIALVKGNALGGGMEAALSAQIIVAERHVKMGLPEVLFNMYPGMGAWHFLSQRLTPKAAEKFILSGKTYAVEELYEMGVVDYIAESGEGEEVVERLVRREKNQYLASRNLRHAIRKDSSVSLKSMLEFVDQWVENAMSLQESDLNHMRYLIRSQRTRGF